MTKLEQLKETLRTTAVRMENQEQAEAAAKIFEALSLPINRSRTERHPSFLIGRNETNVFVPVDYVSGICAPLQFEELESMYKEAVREEDDAQKLHEGVYKNWGGIKNDFTEPPKPIDWEQRRYEIARDHFAQQLSVYSLQERAFADIKSIAATSRYEANALVEELRKGEKR